MIMNLPNKAFTPTDEQLQALNIALSGQSFKIVAYAGAGKTSTLKLISDKRKGRGLYLAFNKAIATEAQSKFAPHVRCQTFHSLAFRHVHKDITAKVALPKMTPIQLAESLNLSAIELMRTTDGKQKPYVLNKFKLGIMIQDALVNFCKTNATHPAPRHITTPDYLDEQQSAMLQEMLYPALALRWQQVADPRHPDGIGHDVYLKLWTLSNPKIPADFVLFDEAQDADPLMMGVLMNQSCQTIYVGDAHQQIYEWRGAVNAMKRLPLEQSLLTQSFRFGEAIADVANILLGALQENIPLRGNPAIHSQTFHQKNFHQKDAYLCRTNASAINLLLKGQKLGHKIALQADSQRIMKFCQAADHLQAGKHAFGAPELAYFNSWQEVQEFAESHNGKEIKTWVKLIDEYDTKTISRAIANLKHINHADYIITTAHKAKGLEWNRVQLADDFLYDINSLTVKIAPEELRLLYVACTRGKLMLDVHHIANLLHGLQNKKLIYS